MNSRHSRRKPPSIATSRSRLRTFGVAARVAILALVLMLAVAPPASAEEPTSTEASELVQQSIALIANGASADRVSEQIEEALAAPDQEGVDLGKVRKALAVVQGPGGDVQASINQARQLLEQSVGAKPADGYGKQPPIGEVSDEPPIVTGAETGTTLILNPLRPAPGIRSSGDVVLFALSLASIIIGLVLSRRFRPRDSIRQLRRASDALPADKEA
jgi:hypothetical protein